MTPLETIETYMMARLAWRNAGGMRRSPEPFVVMPVPPPRDAWRAIAEIILEMNPRLRRVTVLHNGAVMAVAARAGKTGESRTANDQREHTNDH